MRNAVDRKSLPPSPGDAQSLWVAADCLKVLIFIRPKTSNFFLLHDQVSQLLLVCVTSSIRLFRHSDI